MLMRLVRLSDGTYGIVSPAVIMLGTLEQVWEKLWDLGIPTHQIESLMLALSERGEAIATASEAVRVA